MNGEIRNELAGMDATKQRLIDELMLELDGTDNKSRLDESPVLGVLRRTLLVRDSSDGIAIRIS